MVAADRLELVVVRHGLTSWNQERRYQGHRDIPLLLPDAVEGLDRLRDALAGETFDAIHCSDLTRCRQTLAHVREGHDAEVEVVHDARLRELDFGDYEGQCYDQLKDDPAYRAWINSRGEQPTPGGESIIVLRERLTAWLGGVFAAADNAGQRRVLAVTHGGVIRELRRRFETIDFWEGSVIQAQGRRFMLIREGGDWRCSSSSAVPAPVSETP
jgi:alpha-ribazole phosphatase